MKVEEIKLICRESDGAAEIQVYADGNLRGQFLRDDFAPGREISFPLESGRGADFYKMPLCEDDDGVKTAYIDDFKTSDAEEIELIADTIYDMYAEVPAFEEMSLEDILFMLECGCELKRRIVKAVQNLRNEKFIKGIHADYFAKSRF